MTRRHFNALAAALRENRPLTDEPIGSRHARTDRQVWRATVRSIATVCYASNGRFDRGRFYSAAGYED